MKIMSAPFGTSLCPPLLNQTVIAQQIKNPLEFFCSSVLVLQVEPCITGGDFDIDLDLEVYIVKDNQTKIAQTAKSDGRVVPESFTYSKQQLWKRIFRDDGAFFLAQVQVL